MSNWWKKVTALVLLASAPMWMTNAARAEEEDFDLSDMPGVVIENTTVDPAGWNFALSLCDLNPELIKLANKHYLLASDYEPSSKTKMKLRAAVSSTMYLQSECAEALGELFAAAEADGYKLYLKSAYRSYKTQRTMYYNRLEKNNGKDDGWVSKPGASDHQTGLGCDVIPKSWVNASGMNDKMASEPECQWMAEHCWEYGFIIRYPEDKEDVTEINYEPWHLRYVGKPVAAYIWSGGMCLEEFHVELQAAIDEFLAYGGDIKKVEDLIQFSVEN